MPRKVDSARSVAGQKAAHAFSYAAERRRNNIWLSSAGVGRRKKAFWSTALQGGDGGGNVRGETPQNGDHTGGGEWEKKR